MFIPGSYHTFLTLMTCCDQEDYTYRDVSAFENDDFFDENEWSQILKDEKIYFMSLIEKWTAVIKL